MPHVVLVDPHCIGHHLSYLRSYCAILLESGMEVTVLCADLAVVHAYLDDLILNSSGKLRLRAFCNRNELTFDPSRIRHGLLRDVLESYRAFRRFMSVAKTLRVYGVDAEALVLFMWLDDYISKLFPGFILDRFFRNRWGGLYFHPSRIKYNAARARHYRGLLHQVPVFSSSRLAFVGLFDERMVDCLRDRHGRNAFFWLPDVAETHAPDLSSPVVSEVLRRARGRKIVALLGELGERKNLLSFFNVVDGYAGDNVFFVCAGLLQKRDFSEEDLTRIYAVAETAQDRLYFHDEHVVPDVVFDTLFHVSDIIVAVYSRFPSSSNVITRAAMHGKPVIVSEEYLMGEIVSRYGLGACVESGNSHQLSGALALLLHEGSPPADRFSAYLGEYSRESLKRRLQALLADARLTR